MENVASEKSERLKPFRKSKHLVKKLKRRRGARNQSMDSEGIFEKQTAESEKLHHHDKDFSQDYLDKYEKLNLRFPYSSLLQSICKHIDQQQNQLDDKNVNVFKTLQNATYPYSSLLQLLHKVANTDACDEALLDEFNNVSSILKSLNVPLINDASQFEWKKELPFVLKLKGALDTMAYSEKALKNCNESILRNMLMDKSSSVFSSYTPLCGSSVLNTNKENTIEPLVEAVAVSSLSLPVGDSVRNPHVLDEEETAQFNQVTPGAHFKI